MQETSYYDKRIKIQTALYLAIRPADAPAIRFTNRKYLQTESAGIRFMKGVRSSDIISYKVFQGLPFYRYIALISSPQHYSCGYRKFVIAGCH